MFNVGYPCDSLSNITMTGTIISGPYFCSDGCNNEVVICDIANIFNQITFTEEQHMNGEDYTVGLFLFGYGVEQILDITDEEYLKGHATDDDMEVLKQIMMICHFVLIVVVLLRVQLMFLMLLVIFPTSQVILLNMVPTVKGLDDIELNDQIMMDRRRRHRSRSMFRLLLLLSVYFGVYFFHFYLSLHNQKNRSYFRKICTKIY